MCPEKAISIDWETELRPFMERMTEYAYGTVKGKKKSICYINFVLNVTPDCDCAPWSDMPLVPDVGILASTDPVALDQACFDLVSKSPRLTADAADGRIEDKFTARWPHTCGEVQLAYGESLGLGVREYKLKKI